MMKQNLIKKVVCGTGISLTLIASALSHAVVTEQSVKSSKQQAYGLNQSAKTDLNHSPGILTVPASLAATAWDLAGSGSTKNNVIDYVIDNMGMGSYLAHYVSAAVVVFGSGFLFDVTPLSEIKFADGSVATFQVTGFDANGKVKIVLASAKDSLEKSIPLSKSELKESYPVLGPSPNSDINQSISAALIRLAQSGGSGERYKTFFKCKSETECSMTFKQVPWD